MNLLQRNKHSHPMIYMRYEIHGPGVHEYAAEEQALPPHDLHEEENNSNLSGDVETGEHNDLESSS